MALVPMVIEQTHVVSVLLISIPVCSRNAAIFLTGPGGRPHGEPDRGADAVSGSGNPEKDIYPYINSRGGVITAGMSIMTPCNSSSPMWSTICMGQAASMGAFLLTAGGKRQTLWPAEFYVMIHQPLRLSGRRLDIEIHAREI